MYIVLKEKPAGALVASSSSIRKFGEKKDAIAEAERLTGSASNADISSYLVFRVISRSVRAKSPVHTTFFE